MGNESFSEYWKRFNKLCASCPQHQISEQLLIQYFYEGLSLMDRSMVDAASGGALVTKTPEEARNFFNLIYQNTQQFGLRMNEPKKETESLAALTDQIANLTKVMGQMVSVGGIKKSVCSVCSLEGHTSEVCPSFQNQMFSAPAFHSENFQNCKVKAAFNNQGQRRYDPYSNSYNEGWRDHPNLRYGPRPSHPGFQSTNNNNFSANLNNPPGPVDKTHQMLEVILKKMEDKFSLVDQNMKLMQERQTAQDTLLSNLQAQINNRLPAQPFPAPKENVSAVVLRNNKVLLEPSLGNARRDQEIMEKELDSQNIQEPELVNNKSVVTPDNPRAVYKPQPPFPSKYQNQRKNSKEPDDEIFEMFKKVQVNIPLLNAIKNVPKYAKFLKEMCTNKRRLKGDERVSISENVSAIFQKKLPQKCQDPGVFSVPLKVLPWYSELVNYLVNGEFPVGMPQAEKCKLKAQSSIEQGNWFPYGTNDEPLSPPSCNLRKVGEGVMC
ncbi:unnamed protein product [Cuscuta campestris]|uniref:Retrotransposon gag domain-containing protein n=1 Tax=Cuscuta campestris TaxID=132261 RepID=A0A484MCF1_9ASTE|nr:unnamed protein product [Cuscuta campestris]